MNILQSHYDNQMSPDLLWVVWVAPEEPLSRQRASSEVIAKSVFIFSCHISRDLKSIEEENIWHIGIMLDTDWLVHLWAEGNFYGRDLICCSFTRRLSVTLSHHLELFDGWSSWRVSFWSLSCRQLQLSICVSKVNFCDPSTLHSPLSHCLIVSV